MYEIQEFFDDIDKILETLQKNNVKITSHYFAQSRKYTYYIFSLYHQLRLI